MCKISKQSTKKFIGTLLSSRHIILSFSFALLIVFFGNTGTVGAADETRPTEAEMSAVMERHYEVAILSHDALIQGDLEKMRSRLARLAKQELPAGAAKTWKSRHARLHEAASSASKISSLESAGSVMGDVAEACGACHAALGVGNIYYWPAPPDEDDKLKTAMRTHQWATERLWEGVTGPFEEAWPRGAEALAEISLFDAVGDTVTSDLRAREAVLRDMGRRAKAATGLEERADIYGRLLSTCAGCHQEAGVSIIPAKSIPPWQE